MWWIVGGIVGILGIFFLLVKFTIVEEGTAKAIMTFGKFSKMVMSWKGFEFDEEWNVVEGKKFHLGGLRFVGIRGIHTVYEYNFRWTDISIKEGKEVIEQHEKRIDYIFVRPHLYISVLPEIETADLIPTTTYWTFLIRVINPYKVLFKIPVNWLEKLIAFINPILRSYVASVKAVDLLKAKEASIEFLEVNKELKEMAKPNGILEKDWGLKIESVKLREVEAPRYREAIARRTEMEYEALGRSERIMGTIIQAVARAEGKSVEEVQGEFLSNPEEFYKKHKTIVESVISTIAMEEDAYLRIETPGATGALGDFLRLIAAWKRMPPGKSKEKSKKKESQYYTKEEIEEMIRKTRRK